MRPAVAAVALLALIAAAFAFRWNEPTDPRPETFRTSADTARPAATPSQAAPGRFDFYVLALSWSPGYCANAGEAADRNQCNRDRPLAFVVHGLWPQTARGWLENCQEPAPWIPDDTLRGMLDLMPSRGLVIHEWRKHGTCSGLDPAAYFDAVRRAWAKIRIPAAYRQIASSREVAPAEVEQDFLAANPELRPDMIAVTCEQRRLAEVRICLDRSLSFHACPAVDAASCRAPRIAVPAAGGG